MKRIIVLLMVMPLFSIAQDLTRYQLTVEEAVQIAINNSPLLEKARYDKEISNFQARQAVGTYLPQIEINGNYNDNFALPEQQLPGDIFGQPGTTIPVKFGVRYGLDATIGLTQKIYDQQSIAAVRSAEALKSVVRLKELSTQENLAYNVVQTYLQTQVAQQQEALVLMNLERVERLYTISKAQFENGIIKENSVKQLDVNRKNTEAQLLQVQYNIEELLNLLKFHLSLDPSAELTLISDLKQENTTDLQAELSLESNLEYRQLLEQKKLSQINEKFEKAAQMPSVNAFLNYGYAGQTDKFKFSGKDYNSFFTGTWGMSLSIPIFDGLQRKNKIQIAQIESLQLDEDQKYLKQNIYMVFQNAIKRRELGLKQVIAQEANMELAQDVYESTSLSFEEGVSPLSELQDAENSLREAQSNYLTNLLQLKLAELEYLQASGQLASIIEANNKEK